MNVTSKFLRINFEFLQYLNQVIKKGLIGRQPSKDDLKAYLMLFLQTHCNTSILELPSSVQVMLMGTIERLIYGFKKKHEIEGKYLQKKLRIRYEKKLQRRLHEINSKYFYEKLKEYFEQMLEKIAAKSQEHKTSLENMLLTLDLEGLIFYREFLDEVKDIYIRDQRSLEHQGMTKEELEEIFSKFKKLNPQYHQKCMIFIDKINQPLSLAEILRLIETTDSLIMRLKIYSSGPSFYKPILFSHRYPHFFKKCLPQVDVLPVIDTISDIKDNFIALVQLSSRSAFEVFPHTGCIEYVQQEAREDADERQDLAYQEVPNHRTSYSEKKYFIPPMKSFFEKEAGKIKNPRLTKSQTAIGG